MLFKKKTAEEAAGTKRFQVKLTEQLPELGQITILVDTATGVNYIQTWVGTGGGISPLLDTDGNVVIDMIEGGRSCLHSKRTDSLSGE